MAFKSIRWRLPLSYAGIALLSVVALGLVLNAIIRSYYDQQEMQYLRGNAIQIGAMVTDLLQAGHQMPSDKFNNQVSSWSFLLQARIQVLDPQGKVLADSGLVNLKQYMVASSANGDVSIQTQGGSAGANNLSPWGLFLIDPEAAGSNPMAAPGLNCGKAVQDPGGSKNEITCVVGQSQNQQTNPSPDQGNNLKENATPGAKESASSTPGEVAVQMSNSPFGFNLAPDISAINHRSDAKVNLNIKDSSGNSIISIILSDAPAYGDEIESNVFKGWLVASLFAVLLAGGVGFWVSRRITAPLVTLVGATSAMATGNLSTRASIQSADEFGEVGRSFNMMAARVEDIVNTLRGFVADAAHELNTPLATLHASLELVRNNPALPEMARDNVNHAWDETRQLETLTRDLLDLSRLETDQLNVSTEVIDMNELVREASEPFASQAEQCGIQFGLEIHASPLLVIGNHAQLYRVAGNLLENALKFTPSGGDVKVVLFKENQEAILQIMDSGIGIPADDLPFVFNRFHRGRNATGYQGSGLGLAIVKTIIDKHGGKIDLENREVGTKVELHLPCIEEETSK